jgi:predicted MFS family arabinose efflux permease
MTDTGTNFAFSKYQKFVVAVLAFLQFTVVLDFMILSPLGAQLMPGLHITPAQFGMVVSTYAFSAGVSGFLAAGFADRFDRKKLLMLFYAGFLTGTLLCGFASNYALLVFARLVTGLFAGVVSSASLAIIADVFPLQMRGRVMGVIQTAFAASSVLGIPIGLLLSNTWGWNAPFFMIVAVGALVGLSIQSFMRPVNAHLKKSPDRSPLHHILHALSNRLYLQGFATTGLLSVGGFMLMPFMSAFMVHNVGIPIEKLPLIYVLTGLVSVVTGPLIGRASDTFGKFKVFCFGCLVTIVMVFIFTHLTISPLWLLVIVLAVLQVGIFSRMISASALTSALPEPADRGSYMSISSSLQQVAGGVASVLSGMMVEEGAGGSLLHFERVGYALILTTLITLTLMYFINRRIGMLGRTPASAPPDGAADAPPVKSVA